MPRKIRGGDAVAITELIDALQNVTERLSENGSTLEEAIQDLMEVREQFPISDETSAARTKLDASIEKLSALLMEQPKEEPVDEEPFEDGAVKAPEPAPAAVGGRRRRTLRSPTTLRKPRRGGAAGLVAGSDTYAHILDTTGLITPNNNAITPTMPWNGPAPFSAGALMTTDLTQRLPPSLVQSVDPALSVGGGRRRGRAASKK